MDFIKYSDIFSLYILELNKQAKIHQLLSRSKAYVNSFIVELTDKLIIIDTQQDQTTAEAFKQYAYKLNKKIAMVILTHSHWDHYLGVDVFTKYPCFALKDTIEIMKNKQIEDKYIPINILQNKFKIDNYSCESYNIQNAHAEDNLILFIEELKIIFVGDLFHLNGHLLVKHFDAYINQMEEIYNNLDFEYIMSGHWKIGSKKDLKANIDYVKKCRKIYKELDDKTMFDLKAKEYFKNLNKFRINLSLLLDKNPIGKF